jgi:hypothetical protein
MKKGIGAVAAAVAGAGLLSLAGYASAYGGHGFHHHGGSAVSSCVAVMSPARKENLKGIFSGQRNTLKTDFENVATAQKALSAAILSGNKDLSTQETALANARQQLQKDRDAAAMQVCGELNSTQLSAAHTLFNNLSALHESTHQQARSYIESAKTAAGQAE